MYVYTIAKYKDTNFLVGKNPKIQYDFSYEVNGNSYNTYTRATLSNYNLEEDKLLIKYSSKDAWSWTSCKSRCS